MRFTLPPQSALYRSHALPDHASIAPSLPPTFLSTLSWCRYAHASAALLTDGTAVGHLVHVVGAGLAAALASCVIHVVEGILEARERKRLEEKRQVRGAAWFATRKDEACRENISRCRMPKSACSSHHRCILLYQRTPTLASCASANVQPASNSSVQ